MQSQGLFAGAALVSCAAIGLAFRGQQAPCAVFEAKLLAADGAPGDELGLGAAIDGDTAAIGAPIDDDNGNNSGSVYVFARRGSTWNLQQKLLASDGAPVDFFGQSVAVDGDTIVVGSIFDEETGLDSGSAYVFVRSGSAWSEQAKLTASDAMDSDLFGCAVAIDGDTIVAGASHSDPGAANAGAAYVFVRSGTTWSEEDKLVASDGVTFNRFGHSVAVFGDRAVVGAYDGDGLATDSGAAYVFLRTGSSWSEESKLIAHDGAGQDQFGWSVSIDAERALIGAPRGDGVVEDSGAAYVFARSGTSWSLEAELNAADGRLSDLFGNALAISDDRAVIGAPQENEVALFAGSVYVFARTGSLWTEELKLAAFDGAPLDKFGFSLGFDGSSFVAGAPENDQTASNAGAAYAYELLRSSEFFCTGKTNSLGCVPFLSTSGVASATSSDPFNLVGNQVLPGQVGSLMYSFARGNLNFHGGKLCVKAPFARLVPKTASSSGSPPCTGLLTFNFNQRIQSGVDPLLTAGAEVVAQWRQRDPSDPAGFGDSLTNGVEFSVCP